MPFSSVPDPCFNRNRVFSDVRADFIDSKLQRLLTIGAIECTSVRPHCILSMRVVPKKNGKHGLVTNCRPVNTNIVMSSFSHKGITSIAECILPLDILMTVDIKDGFHHILISAKYRKNIEMSWLNAQY